MARGYDCACGEYIEAENDQRLVERMKEHTDKTHPEGGFTESRLRQMAEDGAYDVRPEAG